MLLVYPDRAQEVSGGLDGVGFVVDAGHHDEADAQVPGNVLDAIANGEEPMGGGAPALRRLPNSGSANPLPQLVKAPTSQSLVNASATGTPVEKKCVCGVAVSGKFIGLAREPCGHVALQLLSGAASSHRGSRLRSAARVRPRLPSLC